MKKRSKPNFKVNINHSVVALSQEVSVMQLELQAMLLAVGDTNPEFAQKFTERHKELISLVKQDYGIEE